jgi:hypothetical protein
VIEFDMETQYERTRGEWTDSVMAVWLSIDKARVVTVHRLKLTR